MISSSSAFPPSVWFLGGMLFGWMIGYFAGYVSGIFNKRAAR